MEPADPRLFESKVWYEETILLAVPREFPVNQGLEAYCLSVEDVRNGRHRHEEVPAVDLALFARCPLSF